MFFICSIFIVLKAQEKPTAISAGVIWFGATLPPPPPRKMSGVLIDKLDIFAKWDAEGKDFREQDAR